ncbi:MAG: DUF4157 domain-containing protein [Anaerolineae bacterium]
MRHLGQDTGTDMSREYGQRRARADGLASGTVPGPTGLRRAIGNRATGLVIQAKLRVNEPGDVYEQEADRVADMVMRMPDPVGAAANEDPPPSGAQPGHAGPGMPRIALQREMLSAPTGVHRLSEDEDGNDAPLQAKAESGGLTVSRAVEGQIAALHGGGQPLPEATSSFFEPRLGFALSEVRVHSNSQAAETARAVHARAFTVGRDVVFGAGEYAPGTTEGRRLLAHELVHVGQQGGTRAADEGTPTAAAAPSRFQPGILGLGQQQRLSAVGALRSESTGQLKLLSPTSAPIQRAPADPPPTVTLTHGVGAKGSNLVSDLKQVQDRLKGLGILSDANYTAEHTTLLKDLKDTDKVDARKIPQTIAAIKEYERIVLYRTKPSGQVSKAGNIVGMLNAQQAAPTATDVTNVTTARGTLTTTTVAGGDFTLGGKVGSVTGGNSPTDLANVQNRLVEMGKLKAKDRDAETAAAIQKANPTVYTGEVTCIQSAHIPKTIAAIKSFQTAGQFDHKFWSTRKFEGVALKDKVWTKGEVSQGDMSHFILTKWRKTQWSYTDGAGKAQTLTSANFVKHKDATDAVGYSVGGTADPTSFTVDEFKAFGISDLEARALLFVSKNEGKFNAVNTWDRAGVSFGFVQFAGGTGGGTFPKMMATLKKDNAAVFESRFKKFGIDVEYVADGDTIKSETILALDPTTSKMLRGVEAEAYIRKTPGLMPIFLTAGYDKEVQRAQVKTSVSEYVVPSRSTAFTKDTATKYLKFKQGGVDKVLFDKEATLFAATEDYRKIPEADRGTVTDLSLSGEKVSNYLTSEKARAVVIDLAINTGLGGVAKRMSQGMKAYIVSSRTVDKATLKTASEVEILKQVMPFAFVPDRVQKAIDDSSLSP